MGRTDARRAQALRPAREEIGVTARAAADSLTVLW